MRESGDPDQSLAISPNGTVPLANDPCCRFKITRQRTGYKPYWRNIDVEDKYDKTDNGTLMGHLCYLIQLLELWDEQVLRLGDTHQPRLIVTEESVTTRQLGMRGGNSPRGPNRTTDPHHLCFRH